MANRNAKQDSKPAKTIRIGAVSVSIWRREHDKGVFFNAVLSRAYTQDDGKTWEYSDSLNRDDLLSAAKLLDLAHTWIMRAEQEEKKQGTD